jgi:LPXTG-motif cell wall-anchored protein
MEMKKVNSILLLALVSILVFTFSGIVKAEENVPSAYVRIEGLKGTIIEGNASGANVLEAIEDILKRNKIDYHVAESTFGDITSKYIDKIDGLKSGSLKSKNYDGWQYFIKNKSGITFPGAMDNQQIKNEDNIVLFYGDMETPYANSIKFTPDIVQEKQTFKASFSFNHFDFILNKQVNTPIKGALVTIDNLNFITNDNGEIVIEGGLAKGEHRYKISGYNITMLPTVVMDKGTFIIDNASSTSISYLDNKFNSLYQADNTKIVKNLDNELSTTKNFIKSNSSGDSWSALSLRKIGIKPELTFLKKSAAEVKNSNGVKEFTNTELEKLILVLASSGYTPYDFMGNDLVSELFNRDIDTFLINDAIYGLITLNYCNLNDNYKITREQLIDFILSNKLTYKKDNADIVGWALSGDIINPDITGLAINSLAPLYRSSTEVKTTIDSAVKSLSLLQNESGYIADSFGYFSESIDMVILGLTSVGVNPEGIEFTKIKGDLVSALLSFKGTDGQFKHSLDEKNDYIATEQTFRALIALKEFKEKGIYNYYASDIDSSKLQEFAIDEKELLELGYLPQTGTNIDFSLMASSGMLLLITGILTLRKKVKI